MVGFTTNIMKIIAINYPWNEEKISDYKNSLLSYDKSVKKKLKVNIKKEIVYPIFEQIANENTDIYWKTIFESASLGQFPKGVQFKNNILSFKNKNKIYTQELNMTDYKKCEEEFIKYMQENLSLLSTEDISKKKELIEENININPNLVYDSWNKIKKQFHKNMLIKEFVHKLTIEEKLNKQQSTHLSRIIKLGILCDYFNKSTIFMEDEKISEIKGLYKNDDGYFYINKEDIKIKSIKNRNKKSSIEEETLYTKEGDSKDFEINNDTSIAKLNIKYDKQWVKFCTMRNKRKIKK